MTLSMRLLAQFNNIFIVLFPALIYGTFQFAMSADVKDLFNGGSAMTPTEFPWHLGLLEKPYRKLLCGGTILSETFALTSGRCVSQWISQNESSIPIDPTTIGIIVGSHNRMEDEDSVQLRDVVEIIIHPEFKYDTGYKGKRIEGSFKGFMNDLAILRLETPFNFSECVQPIPLITDAKSSHIENIEIAGWGITDKKQNTIPTGSYRRKAQIPFFSGPQTKDNLKKFGFTLRNGSHILDFNTGIGMNSGLMGRCIGDCGGSVTCREQGPHSSPVLCGIISFGIWCDRYMGSGQSLLFSQNEIYWINSIVHPKLWIHLGVTAIVGTLFIVFGISVKIIITKRRQNLSFKE